MPTMNTLLKPTRKSPIQSYIAGLEPRYIFDAAAAAAGAEMAADLAAQSEAEMQIAAAMKIDSVELASTQSLKDQTVALGVAASSEEVVNNKTLVFVDAYLGAEEIQTLQNGLASDSVLHLINSDSDALKQMASVLEDYQGIESLHIVSHGSAGTLSLGAADVDFNALSSAQKVSLARINTQIADSSDILIYGCDFAAGEIGESAVAQFASLTNADIAASNDATGSADLGADWDLEISTGSIESALAFNSFAQQSFSVVLNSIISISNSSTGAKFWLDADDRGSDDFSWKNKGWDSNLSAAKQGLATAVTIADMNGKQAVVFNNSLYYEARFDLGALPEGTEIVIDQPVLNNTGTLLSHNSSVLTIGADMDGQNHYSGQVAEVLIFDRQLSQSEELIVKNSLSAKWDSPIDLNADLYKGDESNRGNYDSGVVGILSRGADSVLKNSDAGLELSATSLEQGQSIFIGHRDITAPERSSDREWFVTTKGAGIPVELSLALNEIGLESSQDKNGQYRLVKFNGSSWSLVAATDKTMDGKISFNAVTLRDTGIYRVTFDTDVITSVYKEPSPPKAWVNIQLRDSDGQIFNAGTRAGDGFETVRQAERGLNKDQSFFDDAIDELEVITESSQQKLSLDQVEKTLKAFADDPKARTQIIDKIQFFLEAKETILGVKERDMLGDLVRLVQAQENQMVAELEQPSEPVLEALEELRAVPVPVEEVVLEELESPLIVTGEVVVHDSDDRSADAQFSAQLQAATGFQGKSDLLINASAA